MEIVQNLDNIDRRIEGLAVFLRWKVSGQSFPFGTIFCQSLAVSTLARLLCRLANESGVSS